MNQDDFDREYGYIEPAGDFNVRQRVTTSLRRRCVPRALLDTVVSFFPILRWLPKYDLRANIVGDLVGGLTVGIMHIPQSMGYAGLAGMPPIYGLYTSFFPALFYMVMGTSRHVSFGTFAVVDLMVGGVNHNMMAKLRKEREFNKQNLLALSFENLTSGAATVVAAAEWRETVTPIQVLTALAFTVGALQICMAILRLDFTTAYLSDQVVGGFTTGAAIHVFSSQVPHALGLSLPQHSGVLNLIYSYVDLFKYMFDGRINWLTVVVSLITVVILVIGKEFINPHVKKRSPVAIPFDLIVVIIGTAASHFANFSGAYKVSVVGSIPTGIPPPQVPEFRLMPELLLDALGLAIVIFVVEVSLGKTFAAKHNYSIDARQELYALGTLEMCVSFFNVYPASTGLSRSLVYEGAGTKTQIASIFSSGLILIVLLWLGPLFQPLPKCILASIILVALKGMFLQFGQLKYLWPVSKMDFAIWLTTFLATVLIDVKEGLAIGVGFALVTVIYRMQRPTSAILQRVQSPYVNIYKNRNRYMKTEPNDSIKAYRLDSSLIFANSELFKERLYKYFGIDIFTAQKELKKLNEDELNEKNDKLKHFNRMQKMIHVNIIEIEKSNLEEKEKAHVEQMIAKNGKRKLTSVADSDEGDPPPTPSIQINNEDGDEVSVFGDSAWPIPAAPAHAPLPATLVKRLDKYPFAIILDCSSFNYIDVMGMNCLKRIYTDLKSVGVKLFLAECNGHVRDMFQVGGFYDTVPKFTLYGCVHDAFTVAENLRQRELWQKLVQTRINSTSSAPPSRRPSTADDSSESNSHIGDTTTAADNGHALPNCSLALPVRRLRNT